MLHTGDLRLAGQREDRHLRVPGALEKWPVSFLGKIECGFLASCFKLPRAKNCQEGLMEWLLLCHELSLGIATREFRSSSSLSPQGHRSQGNHTEFNYKEPGLQEQELD